MPWFQSDADSVSLLSVTVRQVKTAIAIDTIINQKGQGCQLYICCYRTEGFYCCRYSVKTLEEYGAMDYTTVVASTASELAPLQYIAPYSGCAIGEEWMEQGKDVLVVYDDLSKHAVAYRTLALLLRDRRDVRLIPEMYSIFIQDCLRERFKAESMSYGGGSLTALPIIETQAGDVSAYIPTNVISITDGSDIS